MTSRDQVKNAMQASEKPAVEIITETAIDSISRAEIDMQIATAKQWPRELSRVVNQVRTYATIDPETAESCFYVFKRAGKTIEGPSIRFAEIIASSWGNLRIASRFVSNDGKTVTAQGVCHDLETNVAIATETRRKITSANGRPFSEDMQVVTANAAASIAMRNAILKVVPRAVIAKAMKDVREVALGQAIDLTTARENALKNFAKVGATEEMILFYLEVEGIEDIDKGKMHELKSTWNAIKDGQSTAEEMFIDPYNQWVANEEAKAKADMEAKAAAEAEEQSKK